MGNVGTNKVFSQTRDIRIRDLKAKLNGVKKEVLTPFSNL